MQRAKRWEVRKENIVVGVLVECGAGSLGETGLDFVVGGAIRWLGWAALLSMDVEVRYEVFCFSVAVQASRVWIAERVLCR
jgi:hypothetical protein